MTIIAAISNLGSGKSSSSLSKQMNNQVITNKTQGIDYSKNQTSSLIGLGIRANILNIIGLGVHANVL